MWDVDPATTARLAEIGVLNVGQVAKTPGWSLKELLGPSLRSSVYATSRARSSWCWGNSEHGIP